jgi:hypothetical protein
METHKTLERRNLSRRAVLGIMGATAAASFVAGATEQPAAAPQTSALSQNITSRIIKFDAKPEPIAVDIARTAVIVCDMQNDFGTKGGMFDLAGLNISMIQGDCRPYRQSRPGGAGRWRQDYLSQDGLSSRSLGPRF